MKRILFVISSILWLKAATEGGFVDCVNAKEAEKFQILPVLLMMDNHVSRLQQLVLVAAVQQPGVLWLNSLEFPPRFPDCRPRAGRESSETRISQLI